MTASRVVLQSALDQWSAVDRLTDLTREFCTPEEIEEIEAPLRKRASDSLETLGIERVLNRPLHNGEIPEAALRTKLKKIARRR